MINGGIKEPRPSWNPGIEPDDSSESQSYAMASAMLDIRRKRQLAFLEHDLKVIDQKKKKL